MLREWWRGTFKNNGSDKSAADTQSRADIPHPLLASHPADRGKLSDLKPSGVNSLEELTPLQLKCKPCHTRTHTYIGEEWLWSLMYIRICVFVFLCFNWLIRQLCAWISEPIWRGLDTLEEVEMCREVKVHLLWLIEGAAVGLQHGSSLRKRCFMVFLVWLVEGFPAIANHSTEVRHARTGRGQVSNFAHTCTHANVKKTYR